MWYLKYISRYKLPPAQSPASSPAAHLFLRNASSLALAFPFAAVGANATATE